MYLSAERLEKYHVDLEEVFHQGVNQNYIDLWESYAQDADEMYDYALNNLHYFYPEARPIIELAAEAYREILPVVRKQKYSLHKRAYVNRLIPTSIKLMNSDSEEGPQLVEFD